MLYDFDQQFSKTFVKNCGRNCWKIFQGVEMTLLSYFAWKSSCTSNIFPDVLWFGSTIFVNVCEKLWEKLLKNLSRCRGDSVEQFCFRNFMYFKFCLTFSGKSFDSPKKLCLSNLQITCPDENVLDLVSLEKFFCKCLKAPIKNSSEFRGNLLRLVVKTAFKEFGRNYWRKLFLINLTLKIFHTLTQNLLDFWQEFSRCFVQINFYVSAGSVSGWGSLNSFAFNIFSNFELKWFYFTHEIRTSLSKRLSNFSDEVVDDNFFKKEIFFCLFSDFDQKFFWLCKRSFQQGWVAKSAFGVARWTLHAMKIFL